MTIIIAQATPDGHVWIGSDSRICENNGVIVPGDYEKWIKFKGNMWIGLAGHHRMSTMLQHKCAAYEYPNPYFLAEELRMLADKDGWREENEEPGPKQYDYDAIIVHKGSVWSVHCSGSALNVGKNFTAIGGGSPYAYGAYSIASKYNPIGRTIMTEALMAACEYDSSCGGKLYVEEIE